MYDKYLDHWKQEYLPFAPTPTLGPRRQTLLDEHLFDINRRPSLSEFEQYIAEPITVVARSEDFDAIG